MVYGSGVISREGEAVKHNIDPTELENCRTLAHDAKAIMDDISVGMGSESDDSFFPFFICINADADKPDQITAELIRDRFGGTIFPPATINVEPLAESGTWWDDVAFDIDAKDDDEADADETLLAWRQLMAWFNQSEAVHSPVFVHIGDLGALYDVEPADFPEGTEMTGSVLPRLAIGLTHQGSIVGIFGYIVQT